MTKEQPPRHELLDFIERASREIAAEYERIARTSSDDPGTAGDEGEENWAHVLREWLPAGYHIVTKGRILGRDGSLSRQVDVLVLSPAYPQGLLRTGTKKYLASGVLAAFECKLTLRRQHILDGMELAADLPSYAFPRKLNRGDPWSLGFRPADRLHDSVHGPIAFGLLAHTHEWKAPGSDPTKNITTALLAGDVKSVKRPSQMLEVLCVADLATWTAYRTIDTHTIQAGYVGPGPGSAQSDPHALARLLTKILRRLGTDDTTLMPIASYFEQAGLANVGQSQPRTWGPEIVGTGGANLLASIPSLFVNYW